MALLQIQEPGHSEEIQEQNEVVIGIDLGTTNSLVAVIEDEKVKFSQAHSEGDQRCLLFIIEDKTRSQGNT
jgi:molecular chaperone DnaK (HSP70)